MITKLQFKIELLISYIKNKFLFIIIGILLGSSIFVFKDKIVTFINAPKFQTKYIGVEGLYAFNNLPEEITKNISYGLTVQSENDKTILSSLVKSYDLQNNNKDYIFHLNENINWQNGKEFTAYDVDYQIKGLTISPISPNTLKISVESEFSPLLSLLNRPLFKKNTIGLGDYEIQSITYKEGYINSLKLNPIINNKPTLVYKFYSNENDLINAYKIGNVDEIQIGHLSEELSKWNKTKINQEINTNKKYSAIFFNTKNINAKQLRQALAYATPKTNDKNERCLGPISPNSWSYNPNIKDYTYNPVRAKELYSNGGLETINLVVTDRKLLPVAEEIKQAWSTILNINTTITIENQIDLHNFEAILTYGTIPHDPDQYLFWHSTQTKTNITKLDNSRIDKLLEEGRKIYDLQERKRIYQDFQRFLLEETPAIFLSFPTTYTISRVK